MNKTFYLTLAYILLGATAIICIYIVYAFATEGFSLKLLSIGAFGLAGGLGLLNEARNLEEKEQENEKNGEQNE